MFLSKINQRGTSVIKSEKENGPKAILNDYTTSILQETHWRSISFNSFYYSDVHVVGIFPSRLLVNVHPASTHAINGDSPAIHFYHISVDRGNGQLGGSRLGPPLNQ